jgi:hypothetical protein
MTIRLVDGDDTVSDVRTLSQMVAEFHRQLTLFPGNDDMYRSFSGQEHDRVSLRKSGIARWHNGVYVTPFEDNPLSLYGKDDQSALVNSGITGLTHTRHYGLRVVGYDEKESVLHVFHGQPVRAEDPHKLPPSTVLELGDVSHEDPIVRTGRVWRQDLRLRKVSAMSPAFLYGVLSGTDPDFQLISLRRHVGGLVLGRGVDPLAMYGRGDRRVALAATALVECHGTRGIYQEHMSPTLVPGVIGVLLTKYGIAITERPPVGCVPDESGLRMVA